MLKRMPHAIAAEQSLKSGLFKLRDIAACAYGNGKWIQYWDAEGSCKLTASMGEVIKNACTEDAETAKALAVLSATELPENGVKTMVILLAALLEKAEQLGCTEAEANAVYALLEYAADYLPAIAKENDGALLGSALPYMTLILPLNKRARESGNERVMAVMEYALTTLLLTFAEANGANGYSVYERVKSLAPNQFFSLHQVGIERSISVDSPYTDIWTMGFDPIDGTIKDCRDMAYRDTEEDIRNVLLAVKNALQVIWNIAASL